MYTWDEAKRALNVAKHHLDFCDAPLVYENPEKVTLQSARNDEARRLDIAPVVGVAAMAGAFLVLVYVERENDVHVISFRRASSKERKLYAARK